jgi:hypothetical protein
VKRQFATHAARFFRCEEKVGDYATPAAAAPLGKPSLGRSGNQIVYELRRDLAVDPTVRKSDECCRLARVDRRKALSVPDRTADPVRICTDIDQKARREGSGQALQILTDAIRHAQRVGPRAV